MSDIEDKGSQQGERNQAKLLQRSPNLSGFQTNGQMYLL